MEKLMRGRQWIFPTINKDKDMGLLQTIPMSRPC